MQRVLGVHAGEHVEHGACAGGILSFMIATPDGPAVDALIADICTLAMQQSELASPVSPLRHWQWDSEGASPRLRRPAEPALGLRASLASTGTAVTVRLPA